MSKSPNPSRLCCCSKCSVMAVSIPGTKHRRCGGAPKAAILPRHTWSKQPGTWQ